MSRKRKSTAHGLRVGDTVEVVAVAVDNRTLDDRSLGPNVTRSDPVTLRIVASQALPDVVDYIMGLHEDVESYVRTLRECRKAIAYTGSYEVIKTLTEDALDERCFPL